MVEFSVAFEAASSSQHHTLLVGCEDWNAIFNSFNAAGVRNGEDVTFIESKYPVAFR